MRDRVIIIGGFAYMLAGLGYLGYLTMVVQRCHAQLAAMVGRL